MSPAGTIAVGLFLIYIIPAIFAAAFWACIRLLFRAFNARDVMASLRPTRKQVAAADRNLDDLHIDLHYKVVDQ
jgi:hypothetical protein